MIKNPYDFPAVETVGRKTLLVKGNEVIAEARVFGMVGIKASVQLSAEDYQRLIAPLRSTSNVGDERFVVLRFERLNGTFWESNLGSDDPDQEKVEGFLEDVRVVDEINFAYRMVPDSFKDVKGYGSRMGVARQVEASQ